MCAYTQAVFLYTHLSFIDLLQGYTPTATLWIICITHCGNPLRSGSHEHWNVGCQLNSTKSTFYHPLVQEIYHLQQQRVKSVKHEYGSLHDNLPQTLPLWYLFTATSPNMDFETTFFGQLKKPPSVLQEVVKLLWLKRFPSHLKI